MSTFSSLSGSSFPVAHTRLETDECISDPERPSNCSTLDFLEVVKSKIVLDRFVRTIRFAC